MPEPDDADVFINTVRQIAHRASYGTPPPGLADARYLLDAIT